MIEIDMLRAKVKGNDHEDEYEAKFQKVFGLSYWRSKGWIRIERALIFKRVS